MKERLRGSDYRFIAVCLALLAGCTWYAYQNFYRAFPEASIDFRVNREDARKLAQQFLEGRGFKLGGYREAASFTYDDDAKTFLEREAGLERANQLMQTRLHVWHWSYRWFVPLQKEEFQADITPGGAFAGFEHELPEAAERTTLPEDQARSKAEQFLRDVVHRDPGGLDFVESSSARRPRRTDYTFTWKEHDFELHGATNRVEVEILGNELGSYREYLKIPEQWTRDYERLRSKNSAAQQIDLAAMAALMLGMVVVIVQRVRRKDIRWRRAAMIGVTGMALSFLASLNQFPLNEFGYPTTDAYSSFLVKQVLDALLSALGTGGFLFLVVAGADAMYRHAYPGQVSVGNLFRPRGLRGKRFFLGAILGITLTAIFIAYQTGFYIVAYRFGAWSPADVPYSDLLNTRFPWLYVLFGGFFPAIFEEFTFRMFAIPFLRKVVRWLPGAVVLAGFIWGFGHAGYPQQPFFIRGLEVGIGGVVLGCVMLRWGILPTLVWHYSVDAMYSAMLLLRSHSLYFKLSGAASAGIIVLPVVVALVAYWRRGGFEPETGLLNADEPGPGEPELPATEAAEPAGGAAIGYRALSSRWRIVTVGLLIAGVAMLAIPVERFGEKPHITLTKDQAESAAAAFLRSQGVDVSTYRHVTYPVARWGGDDSLAGKYFFERLPVKASAKLFEENRPVKVWSTRFFQSLKKEEFLVTVHPETGKVIGYRRELPEDEAGADLSEEHARGVATAFASAQGIDLSRMDLKENDSEKRRARRDYTFVWEARPGDPRNVDEAHYRITIGVAGDRISELRAYWKIPEAYERSRDRQNALSIVVQVLTIGFAAGAALLGLWVLIRNIRHGLVPWRRVLLIALLPASMTAVNIGLTTETAMNRGYQTSMAFETWQVLMFTGFAISALAAYVVYTAGIALLASSYPDSLKAFGAARRRAFGVDALFVLCGAAGLWMMFHQGTGWLVERLHTIAIPDVSAPSLIGIPAPVLAAVTVAVRGVMRDAVVIALAALALRMIAGRKTTGATWALALLAAGAQVPDEVRTAGESGLEFGMALVFVVGVWFFCRWIARENYLAYALVFWMLALVPGVVELHSWALAAIGLLTVAAVVGSGLVGDRTTGATS